MTSIEFLSPRLCGTRFEGAAIPLEILKDLAVIEEMVIEVAKWKYLEDHPKRKRIPRRFSEGIELKLTGVEEGSTRVFISMVITSVYLATIPPPNQLYFEEAREAIVAAIAAAEQNQPVGQFLPDDSLNYFDRIGRSLREGESIEFATPQHPHPARLTKETRRKLVLTPSRAKEVTEEVSLRGSIPEVDQDDMTFELLLNDGHKVKGPLPEQHLETILSAFTGYRRGIRVVLQGIGKFNRQNRLLGLESIEHISLLDPLDVPTRLDEFRSLKDGWLEGGGMAPSHDGLNWISQRFDHYYPDDLPLPYIYPTEEGGVRAEWSLGLNEVSLAINLETHQGIWHRLDLSSDLDEEKVLDLDEDVGWNWIVGQIQGLERNEV